MKDYHPYVFDIENREFVGNFDEMYQAESKAGFDSWHQEDLRHLSKKICHSILSEYNFGSVLDIGCGKGANTQFLKKNNNTVVGIDISQTALTNAAGRFPDIHFSCNDIESNQFCLNDLIKEKFETDRTELIVCLEVLSYIENWRVMLKELSSNTDFCLCCLYLPYDPIGYVKSAQEFEEAFGKSFQIIENIYMKNQNHIILFGESRR